MASLIATLTGGFLRTTGLLKRGRRAGPDFEKQIILSRHSAVPLPTRGMHQKLAVSHTIFEGRSVWTMAPKHTAPAAHMLYFHGGAYVAAPVGAHWNFLANLVGDHGFAITAPLYPLAPETHAADVTAFALKLYQHFIARHNGPFLIGGDSAGAGLAAAAAHAARDTGLPRASGLLLICPWLDVAANHPEQAGLEKRDCILTIDRLQQAGRLYAGDLPVTDLRVSPIHADWSGLPPILCFGGDDDILVTDARALKAKLPETEYIEGAGLMHDWLLFPFPEARDARRKIADFAAQVTA